MTHHISQISNKSNTVGVSTGAETAYPSGTPEFTTFFLMEVVFLNLQSSV
jgi:hypothetical protein